jgi:hypothetical protein
VARKDLRRNPAKICRKRPIAGKLFVYVNDVALPIPVIQDLYYWNKRGTAKVTVECHPRRQ